MILFGFRRKEAAPVAPDVVRSVSASETGLARTDNQDHVFVDDARLVYCVADGVGGGSDGAYASEIVCANLKMVTYAADETFKSRTSAVEKALEDANAALFARARERGVPLIASTVAALVLDPANPRHAAVCHVGDSRVYRFRRGMPELLTTLEAAAARLSADVVRQGAPDNFSLVLLEV